MDGLEEQLDPVEPELNVDAGGENDSELPMDCNFEWEVKKFSKLCNPKVESPIFEFGSRKQFKWRVLLFPRGNQVEDLSIFVDVADAEDLPTNWRRNADFHITIVNHKDPKKSIHKEGSHVFNLRERDRGFSQFTDRKRDDVVGSKSGFLTKDDTLTIKCNVHLCREWIESADTADNEDTAYRYSYDSKKETGFVGMKNQGATCYLNSLLQSLYHLPILRKAVYLIPTDADKQPRESIPLALQRLFYKLQYSNEPVGTSELTQSFGWTSDDAATQHDIQEFCRKLFENIEVKMKKTAAEGTIEKLFRGTMYNFIKCTEVDYESVRTEDFYDISLNVKGCRDLYESLRKYTEVELLDGDNKYKSDKYGLQPAKKGILFDSFPPLLHLHLKRFEYDWERDQYVKVNDKLFFPAKINLSEFLSPNANRNIDYTYHLHGVLVHTGSIAGGHYYAFLRPTLGPQWYRFDDTTVYKVSAQKAIDDNFGNVGSDRKSGSAYMLVYALESARKNIFTPLAESDIPVHLENRFNEEKKAERDRITAEREQENFVDVHFVTNDDFADHNETDLFQASKTRLKAMKKDAPLTEILAEAALMVGKPEDQVRLWRWCKRKNGTLRIDGPITSTTLSSKKVGDILKRDRFLPVWVEVATGEPPAFLPADGKDNMIISFKKYEAATTKCRFIGHVVCRESDTIGDLVPKARALMGLADDAPIDMYEEVRPTMIDKMDKLDLTLETAELGQGDIIILQDPSAGGETTAPVDFPTPVEYFDYLNNRIFITLKKLGEPKETGIKVALDETSKFADSLKIIGAALKWDPFKIRLTPSLFQGTKPASLPLRPTSQATLKSLYVKNNEVLFYELMDTDVEELLSLKELSIIWRDKSLRTSEPIKVHIARDASVADLIAKLQTGNYEKVKLEGSKQIRIFSVFNYRIDQLFSPETIVAKVSEPTSEGSGIIAEEIPEEEVETENAEDKKKDKKEAFLVRVAHSAKPITPGSHYRNQFHSQPFFFLVKKGEKFADTKKRLQQRMHLPDEKFAQLGFLYRESVVGQVEPIPDDAVLSEKKFDSVSLILVDYPEGMTLNGTSPGGEKSRKQARREKGIEIKG